MMKAHPKVVLAIANLALSALACQAITGDGNGNVDVPTSSTGNNILLSDDFTDEFWGTGTDADSSVEYANNALQMIVYTDNYFVWSTPDEESYQNIHMEVTVTNNGTDSTTAFGLMCNMASNSYDFYYLAMTPAGQYAIAKAAEGEEDLFLTNNDEWADSTLIAANASSYRIGVDCGRNILTLYVDGKKIDSVTDSSYTSGLVGLFTWSDVDATTTNVSFDDFLMAHLP